MSTMFRDTTKRFVDNCISADMKLYNFRWSYNIRGTQVRDADGFAKEVARITIGRTTVDLPMDVYQKIAAPMGSSSSMRQVLAFSLYQYLLENNLPTA